jgi:hypothetical protein
MSTSAPASPAAAAPAPSERDLPTSLTLGDLEVALIRWPEEASLREGLAARGRPRHLLVEQGALPPDILDGPEDWLRCPPDPAELLWRAQHVRHRAAPTVAEQELVLEDHGVLRRGDRWVAISEAQLPILELLLEHLDRVVPFDEVVAAYGAEGGSSVPASVRTVVSRLEQRIRPLGIDILSVRRRGIVLRSNPNR